MLKLIKRLCCAGVCTLFFGVMGFPVCAKEEDTILPGIYVEDMSLGGMTKEEAREMLDSYVAELGEKEITLVAVEGNSVVVTPKELGFYWCNQEIVDEAAKIGQSGNVVQRYKAAKDLEYKNVIYKLEFDIDRELTAQVLAEQCAVYNKEAMDATLTRQDGEFVIVPGQTGQVVDEAASVELLYTFFNEDWNGESASIGLEILVDEVRGSKEELAKVQDVLGTFSTSFKTSGSSRSANVRNGCALINGITLYPGDEFSTYETVSPFSTENGYHMAGSYLNGQVVDSLGGGICQVSTTLYNAVLLAELEVTERHNHSMIVSYVDPSADAAIAESAGKDFKFVNNTEAPIYIEGYTTDDKQICFTIYGMETRDASRQVSYESEIISKTYPDTEVIYTDAAAPIGTISVQSAHIGYKANLWKIVKENGAEVSREMVNSSTYKMVPRYATVGVATEDINAYNQLMDAIATNSIDHVKEVAGALSAAAAPAAPSTEVPGQEQPVAEAVPAQ